MQKESSKTTMNMVRGIIVIENKICRISNFPNKPNHSVMGTLRAINSDRITIFRRGKIPRGNNSNFFDDWVELVMITNRVILQK